MINNEKDKKMKEQLISFIEKLKVDREKIISFDEAATKQAIIVRLLSLLGWDIFNIDEVTPEYSVGGRKVDYSLRFNSANKIFIEVKKIGENLENHQEQLLNYSFQEGVKLAILTNGITWWFYLPLHEGSWEQRKFYTVEVYEQDAEEIAQKLTDFLSKESVISGKAIENAESIFKSKQRQNLIKETLPKAWHKIIEGPDEALIELIAETTEKLCGYKPEHSTVENFIKSIFQRIEYPFPQKLGDIKVVQPTPRKISRIEIEENYTYRSISSFIFRETRYEVRSWKDMLIKICDIMFTTHTDRFDQVLNLVGLKRPYFTRNPNELRVPKLIKGTDIYVETNLSANGIVSLTMKILHSFGYTKDDISIEAR